MSYAKLTTESPSLLKRFSHAKRFDVALELLAVEPNDEVLDYGTGDGFMLKKLLSANPRSIVGYEPMESQYEQLENMFGRQEHGKTTIATDLGCVAPRHFDKICCLEVLEHLPEHDQISALTEIKQLLKSGGVVVVSVPIEVGLSGLLKNFARWIIRQEHANATFINMWRAFFGQKIDRGQEAYITTHIGFDYRDLEKLIISEGYKVKKKRFSPLKGLNGVINSQIFFVLEETR